MAAPLERWEATGRGITCSADMSTAISRKANHEAIAITMVGQTREVAMALVRNYQIPDTPKG